MPATTKRQRELLSELREHFLTEGFSHLTLDDLTRELSCSKTTLYALGETKDELISAVLISFFRAASEQVEGAAAREEAPEQKIGAYLRAVADALRPASPAFIKDLSTHPRARQIYSQNTKTAALRIREMIAEGVTAGEFRAVNASFVADVAANAMERIQRGDVAENSGLSDAEAYEALAELILAGIGSKH